MQVIPPTAQEFAPLLAQFDLDAALAREIGRSQNYVYEVRRHGTEYIARISPSRHERLVSCRPIGFPAYHARQGSAPSSPPPRPSAHVGAPGLCLGVLHGWEIVRTTTSRQVAGPRTLRAFITIMIVHEAVLDFQLARYGDDEPLTTTKRLLHYLTAGIAQAPHESFWIVCMNPKRRAICRIRLAEGPCVTCSIGVRQIIRAMLLADAMAVACLRTDTGPIPRPNLADGRLLWALRETTRYMNMELVDYLVAKLDTLDYHSWREHERPAV